MECPPLPDTQILTDRAGYGALHARTHTRTHTRTHQPISSEILAVDVDVSPAAFVAPTR
jgi:hypothetical protein